MKSQRKIRWTTVMTGILLSALAATNAFAQPTLDTLVGQSDLVFQGVVQGMEYRMSNPGGPEGTSVPYTYVTYRVDNVIRGEAEPEITLRFIGGLDEENGLYLQTSHSPQFDIGDEDVLFVQGNTERAVPLVAEFRGRLRVIGGQIYDENAHSINVAQDGSFIVGARYNKEQAASTIAKGRIMVRDLGPRAVDGDSDAMLAADLLQQVQRSATIVPEAQFQFVSADINLPVDAPDMTPAEPPTLPVGDQAAMDDGNVSGEKVEVQPAVKMRRENE